MNTGNGSDSQIFGRNLKALADRFPDLVSRLNTETVNDRLHDLRIAPVSGRGVISVRRQDGQWAFLYDEPSLEVLLQKIAATQAPEACDTVFLLGFGLGHAAIEILKHANQRPRIVIIEPSCALFRLSLAATDLQALFMYDRLSVYLGEDANVLKVLNDEEYFLPVGRTILFKYPYRRDVIGDGYYRLEAELIHRIRSVRDMWHTTRKFGRQMLYNTLANLRSLAFGTPMRCLRERFNGIPAVCIAAGPTLNESLPLLKRIDNALLIACDSAVGTLLQAGIEPHIVATADIHPANIAKLRPYMDRLRQTVLLFSLEANPDNVRTFLGQRRVGVSAYSRLLLDWLEPRWNLQCQFPQMTSVTHLAVSFAVAVGANPIVLVGVDLAHVGGVSHASGSVFRHVAMQNDLIAVPGIAGKPIHTPAQYVTDRLILEQNLAAQKNRIINTSLKGALLNGASIKSLEEVVDTELKQKTEMAARLAAIDWANAADENALHGALVELEDRFKDLLQRCRQQHDLVQQAFDPLHRTDDESDLTAFYNTMIDSHASLTDQFGRYLDMIGDAMLDEEQSIRKEKAMNAAKGDPSPETRMIDDLEILRMRYQSITACVEAVLDQLAPVIELSRQVKLLQKNLKAGTGGYQERLAAAGCLERFGETWQAVSAYEKLIEMNPMDSAVYLSLLRAYIQSGLWNAAQRLLKIADEKIPHYNEFQEFAEAIEKHADEIWHEIEKYSSVSQTNSARKLLHEYQALRPEDPKVKALAETLQLADGKALRAVEKKVKNNNEMHQRLKNVTAELRYQRIEPAAGIIEGLCDDFPSEKAKLRELIGDIRFMQKDYDSALWHFQKALGLVPGNRKIIRKIEATNDLRAL